HRKARLQAVGVPAAERVEIPVLRTDELHLERNVRMPSAASVNDEVRVGALLVHIAKPRVGVIVTAALSRKVRAHKSLEVTLFAFPRRSFPKAARRPASPPIVVPEAIPVPVRRLP